MVLLVRPDELGAEITSGSTDISRRAFQDAPMRISGTARTLVDDVADTVRSQILRGQFAVGDRLPPEREFVKELGVSRTVVREALSALEALGLIDRRTTNGRFVAVAGSTSRSETLVQAWLYHHRTEISHADEVRALTESHAVRTMTEDDAYDATRRGRMLLLDQAAALERDDPRQAAKADVDFHRLLSSYTENPILRSLITALIDQTWEAALAVYSLPEAGERSLKQHEAIIDALARANRDLAADLLWKHSLETQARLLSDRDEPEAR